MKQIDLVELERLSKRYDQIEAMIRKRQNKLDFDEIYQPAELFKIKDEIKKILPDMIQWIKEADLILEMAKINAKAMLSRGQDSSLLKAFIDSVDNLLARVKVEE